MNPHPDTPRRYARHLSLQEIGAAGQELLRRTSVLCIGAGGLGSPAILYLAAAGIGRLGIADFDRVELSNLQRQIVHGTPDLGRPKTDSACESARALNPHVDVVAHPERVTAASVLDLIRPYDIILDGTDNFAARYLVNDACVFLRKPNVYGAVLRFEGQASVFAPHLDAPCYRCLYPEPPAPGTAPGCAEAGVLGVVPGLLGTIQATEALKLALRIGTPLLGRLLLVNALHMTFREMRVRRDPECPLCGNRPTITRLVEYPIACTAPDPGATPGEEVDVREMQRALDHPELGISVLDVRELEEYQQARIPGTLLFPLSQLTHRASELDPTGTYYLHCRSGIRSLEALRQLRQRGFRNLRNVKGGILAWNDIFTPT